MSDRQDARDETPTVPPRRYDDEVSLRDLYLILRRGAPTIVVVTVLAAVLGGVAGLLLPRSYRAEAVVEYTPAIILSGAEGATQQFDPTTSLAYPAYRSLALGTDVVRALAQNDELPGTVPTDLDRLRGRLATERVSGPETADRPSPLTVAHRAEAGRSEDAVLLAEAFARSAMEAVRAWAMQDDGTAGVVPAAVEEAEAALSEADEALAAFRARDDRSLRQARLRSAIERDVATAMAIETLKREVAAMVARADALAAAEARGETVAVEGTEALTAAQARAEVEALRATLAATEADAGSYEAEVTGLREAIARLDLEAQRLEEARSDAAADLTALQEESRSVVAPPRVRLTSDAVPPSDAEGVGPVGIAFAAGLLALLTSTVLVFLREAVKAPEPGASTG